MPRCGGLDVDVVADVDRVLAAELELHLDHACRATASAIFAPVA